MLEIGFQHYLNKFIFVYSIRWGRSAVHSVHDQAIGALRGRGGFGVWFSRWFLQIVFTDGFWRWFCDGFAMIFEVAVEMVLEMPQRDASEISLGMPLRPWTSEWVSKCFLQWRSFEIALRRLGWFQQLEVSNGCQRDLWRLDCRRFSRLKFDCSSLAIGVPQWRSTWRET